MLYNRYAKRCAQVIARTWSRKYGKLAKKVAIMFSRQIAYYYYMQAKRGKTTILPYADLVVTTKCSLNCAGCYNMMQYFTNDKQYTSSNPVKNFRLLESKFDKILQLNVIGGEAFLHPKLAELIKAMDESPKLGLWRIYTNATIMPSKEFLEAVANTKKGEIFISDYRHDSDARKRVHIQEMADLLAQYNIRHRVLETYGILDGAEWISPGRVYKRNRPVAEVVDNYKACQHICVCLLDNKLFACPIAASLSKLVGIDKFKGDYLDINEASPETIRKWYSKNCFEACDYCSDRAVKPMSIPVAQQLKGHFDVVEADESSIIKA